MSEQNKKLLQDYIKAVWDDGNVDALETFLDPNYRRHRSPKLSPLNRDQQKELLIGFRSVFPDIIITIEDMVSEGDRIAFRSTMRGTHQGPFLGIEPTGKSVEFGLLDIFRIENGKVIEQWGGPDIYDLLQQLRDG